MQEEKRSGPDPRHGGRSHGGFHGGHGWGRGDRSHERGHHPGGPFGPGGEHGHRGGGFFRGGPGGGGRLDGPPRDRARRGAARYVLLDTLREGPKHGYEIIKALEEKSGGLYAPSPGTVYPTMQYLEDQGLVRADRESERRVYHLTDAGRAELEAQVQALAAFWSRFSGASANDARRPALEFLWDAIEDLNRTIRRGLEHADDPATIGRVRVALEQCQTTVREILLASRGAETSPNSGTSQEEV